MSRWLALLATIVAAASLVGSAPPGSAGIGARATGEDDSPWPRSGRLRPNVRAADAVMRNLERRVELMELSADAYASWRSCIRGVPVSEYGDPDGRFGYAYDERDGTGRGHMPALAVDRKSRPRREDYLFLAFSRRPGCRSQAPLPGGTADPATASASRPRTVRGLERRLKRLKRNVRRLLRVSEQFDEWESCVSWVPVTEYGDPNRRFGYLFGRRGQAPSSFRPALAIDRSDWDDPDYMFLAFVGGDRPGRGCQDEPGEGVD